MHQAKAAFIGWCAAGVGASVISIALYWKDKRAAVKDTPRIAEKTLLVWAAVGGWPGAILAAQLLRHKTIKTSYRLKFLVAIAVHVIATLALFAWLLL